MIKSDRNGAKRHKLKRISSSILALLFLLTPVSAIAAQEHPDVLPKVVQHAEPVYPPLARQTRIQGDVRVKISTDGESVRDAQSEAGHPLLRTAAEDNVKTWKFVVHTPSSFQVTFRYKLLSESVDVEFLESPGLVKIAAAPPKMIIDYASLGLGTWKAQMIGAHGRSWRVFELSYTGADGTWLNASTLNPKGESEESDFGHKEGDFLAFTITLSRPDGQHVKTFFVGKITGNKIIGTFVDAAGTSGKWTAVRTPYRRTPD